MPDIRGVETDIIEGMFDLILKYPLADDAGVYLETRTGEQNQAGVANIRDALSHFRTIIANATTATPATHDDRKAQLASASEHLRRATIEPYERCANIVVKEKIQSLYSIFVHEVLPRRHKLIAKGHNVPTLEAINTKLRVITGLVAAGRHGKRENDWTERWGEGLKQLKEAHELAENLRDELQQIVDHYRAWGSDRWSTWYFVWGLSATLLSAALGIVITILLSR